MRVLDLFVFFELLGCDLLTFALALALSEAPFAALIAPWAVEFASDCAAEAVLLAAFVALLVSALPLTVPLALALRLVVEPPAPALALGKAPAVVVCASLAEDFASDRVLEAVSRPVFLTLLASPLAFTDASTLVELPPAEALVLPLPANEPSVWPDADWPLCDASLFFDAFLVLLVWPVAEVST